LSFLSVGDFHYHAPEGPRCAGKHTRSLRRRADIRG
jgi:hypothetical protein